MADEASYYQGDRRPYLRVTLERGGAAIDLTAASGVSFRLYRRGKETLTPLVDNSASVVDAATGVVEYQWAAGDLDLYGKLTGAFFITWAAGVDEGVPDNAYIPINVLPSAT